MLLLRPAAALFGVVVALRNRAYDRKIFTTAKTGVPVVSVGNITAGGSGKTPLTEYIVGHYIRGNVNTGVLSRGYKRSTTGSHVVSDGRQLCGTADDSGDEPYQIARKYPSAVVVVDEDRVRGAELMSERFHPGCIVLDDGFQHRRIARDLDIVVIDGKTLQKMPALLPAGRFREPLSSLGRAGCVVLLASPADLRPMTEIIQKYFSGPLFPAEKRPTAIVRISDRHRVPLGELRNKPATAFCGIAQPDSFRSTVAATGVHLKNFRAFGDHYRYTADDLKEIRKMSDETGTEMIITTEKDAVRIAGPTVNRDVDDRWYFIEIEINFIEGEPAFRQLLDRTVLRHA
jgi:tetraacyldisaccharide 4'-kinase